MMKKMVRKVDTTAKKVGLDMDGVLIDHTETKMHFGQAFGWNLWPHETASDVMKQKVDSDLNEIFQKLIYDDPIVGLMPKIMEGAVKGLAFLKANKMPFSLISRRKVFEVGEELLKRHGIWPGFLSEKNVFFVETKEDKNKKAKELGISIYLDDQPAVLEKLVDVPHRFLLDSHSVYPEASYYRKVYSWDEFTGILEEEFI